MSAKNNPTLAEQIEQLDALAAWFEQDDFDIEEESRSKKEVFKRIKRIRKNAPQHVA